MKLITRDTDYALRALCFIARQEERIVTVPELTRALKIPRAFLRKILQALGRAGILKSYRGKKGGFSLCVAANKLFITDLIKIFQGDLRLNECFFKKSLCPRRRTCLLKRKIDSLEHYVIEELSPVTITDLLKE